jgi:hypothetical protein
MTSALEILDFQASLLRLSAFTKVSVAMESRTEEATAEQEAVAGLRAAAVKIAS